MRSVAEVLRFILQWKRRWLLPALVTLGSISILLAAVTLCGSSPIVYPLF